MIQLNEQDADLLAKHFRKLLRANEKTWSEIKSEAENIKQLTELVPHDEEIEKKLEQMKAAQEATYNKYLENNKELEKALLLCMVGSDEI